MRLKRCKLCKDIVTQNKTKSIFSNKERKVLCYNKERTRKVKFEEIKNKVKQTLTMFWAEKRSSRLVEGLRSFSCLQSPESDAFW